MPGDISRKYKGPKDGHVPSWMDEPSPPALAQPIAWRWRHSSSRKWEYGEDKPDGPSSHLFEVQPLYAALNRS